MPTPSSTSFCGDHGVSEMPMAGNSVPWNTIAPVMLPNASVSLRLRIHRIEFTFSGNSVATGMIISDSSSAEMPMMGAASSTPWMKPLAPATRSARPSASCTRMKNRFCGRPKRLSSIGDPASVAWPSSTSLLDACRVSITYTK